MKKKILKISSIIFVFIIIVFIVYKVDSINRRREKILEETNKLLDCIANNEFKNIKRTVRKEDGTELSEQQIYNFLLNTELYRIMLPYVDQCTFTYSTPDVNFLNTREGSIVFNVKALNGDIITNELKYIRDGAEEYFTTDKIQESNKEKERYYFEIDLADNSPIKLNENYNEENMVLAYKDDAIDYVNYIISNKDYYENPLINWYVKEDNGKMYFELYKDIREDFKISKINNMQEYRKTLKSINKAYDIVWDDKFEQFSVYYDESVDSKPIAITEIKGGALFTSLMIHALDGIKDWHATINYYDYNTRQLLKTQTYR